MPVANRTLDQCRARACLAALSGHLSDRPGLLGDSVQQDRADVDATRRLLRPVLHPAGPVLAIVRHDVAGLGLPADTSGDGADVGVGSRRAALASGAVVSSHGGPARLLARAV